jgi:CRISPR-associated endonuclease/helicase Cas3
MAFGDDFALLTGNPPFPWQQALFARMVAGDFPKACDLPTGLGKTSVIALWILALAQNPRLPRRLVYVVNRRTVVDQSTAEAERLRVRLLDPSLSHVRTALDAMAAVPATHPLAISTLRGEFADNAEWRRDPSRPAVVVGTVDMVGSRLLFSGYGCGFRSKPLHAGFLGQDVLLVHDEAHLEPAFQELLAAIATEQRSTRDPRPLAVLALSATGRTEPDFTLGPADHDNPVVARRLHAKKGLRVHEINDRAGLLDRIVKQAAALEGKVVVFLSSVELAEKCAKELRKAKNGRVATLTGTMRGAERDQLVLDPIFARFLPRPAAGILLQEGSVFLVATSAGEVGIDLSADHMVTDLAPIDSLAQRLGRVNRYGEGDAQVHVICEPLKAPTKGLGDGGEDEEDDKPGKRKDELDHARYRARQLLDALPLRADGSRDASPVALRGLARDARLLASTPTPDIRPVDGMLFDRWACTTVTGRLPGRPPVAEWLRGKAEWEPPRTSVAWRSEVDWLTPEHLGRDALDDFLADYPLRSREVLGDLTVRVLKHLQAIALREGAADLRAWLIRPDEPASFWLLADLLDRYDAKRNPILDGATVVLAPRAGALAQGLLDGAAGFDPKHPYDLGPKQGERAVVDTTDALRVPSGMRLVRSIRVGLSDEDEPRWWHLCAVSKRADDEGSRSSRRELLLADHLRRTEVWAVRLAERLGLGETERLALARAGRAHDLGKSRRVWQRSIKRYVDPPLAKGPMQPAELGGYRHELGSLHDGDFEGLAPEAQDLALHAVASHHGRARPHFPLDECFDPEVAQAHIDGIAAEVPLRFDRLQRRYGRWGLAWLESVLRAADVLGSEDDEVAE